MNNISICGVGFVGNAVLEGMRHAFNVFGYDKVKGFFRTQPEDNSPPEVPNTFWEDKPYQYLVTHTDRVVFVCVPTPMNKDGSCNTKIVEGVVAELAKAARKLNRTDIIVVIKSTVPPGTTTMLNGRHPEITICFNPEFLRERSAIQDFKEQINVLFGGPKTATTVGKELFKIAFPYCFINETSAEVAEFVKYTVNSFLATKVAYANELKQICDKMNVDYNKVVEYATYDTRLGDSHWSVPGPDGQLGFGGKCFPKDLNALMHLARTLDVKPDVMQAAWDKNLEIRSEQDWFNIEGAVTKE